MVYELKRINVWSVIKIVFLISFFLGALIGVFYAFMMAIVDQIFQNLGDEEFGYAFNLLNGISLFFLILFFAIFTSFFHSALCAIFIGGYNLLAQWIGGIKLELTSTNAVASDAIRTTNIQYEDVK